MSDDRYWPVRELGRGMAGVVHEAVDPEGTRVVMKSLRPHVARRADLVQRFRREALLMREVSHPNIMPVLDVQTDADPPFYVMPWVEGRTLRAQGPLHVERALEVLRGTASALAALHREGLVHRDLKPENIFLATDGRVLVFDFGLARRTQGETLDVTKEGQILGTPAYMAPEQIRSGEVDGRTDVYALGVLALELVSGKNPFLGEEVVETCRRQLVEVPPRLDEKALPRLAPLVAAMLAKARDQRPSAQSVLEALEAELRLATPAPRPTQRRPIAALAIAQPLPRVQPRPAAHAPAAAVGSPPRAPAKSPATGGRAPTAAAPAPGRTTSAAPPRQPPASRPPEPRGRGTSAPLADDAPVHSGVHRQPSPASRIAAMRARQGGAPQTAATRRPPTGTTGRPPPPSPTTVDLSRAQALARAALQRRTG